MDIGSSFIADREATIAVEPGQRALDHPAMPTEPFAGVDALAGDTDPDVTTVQRLAAAGGVIPFIGMQLGRALTPPPVGLLDGWDSIEQFLEDDGVVAVRSSQQRGERATAALDHTMALRPRFAAIRGIRTDEVAPLLAGMLAASNEARLQSIWSASPRRSSSLRCSRSQTPASCQSRKRRQQVTPEPQPISRGSISHGMPDLRTKMMPLKQARSETRGRPPRGLGWLGGEQGFDECPQLVADKRFGHVPGLPCP